ncbi:uncharacterized protein LOC143174222 isoform X2 [Nomia melanderi]|uniref:uncharacterized protein LOC143174222 isoform X2 n=1 Tax=Nomia melanderi TaxID=2448451 RepID=UPI003FCD031A
MQMQTFTVSQRNKFECLDGSDLYTIPCTPCINYSIDKADYHVGHDTFVTLNDRNKMAKHNGV